MRAGSPSSFPLFASLSAIFTAGMFLSVPVMAQPSDLTWTSQSSGVTVSLRGISAVSKDVAWASGAEGTILKTTDGGETWVRTGPSGIADVDFRDIEAIDERTVFAMSAGEGEQSRLYKTVDGGTRWQVSRLNVEPDGFWDAIAFWDESYGILAGDPTKDSDGRFTVLTTRDGGSSWEAQRGPKARDGEALFAASGTSLFARGTREAWIGTGGIGGGRVFHTEDGGDTWDEQKTPLGSDKETAGIYSIAFRNGPRGDGVGIAVGGDYTQPDERTRTLARSTKGGSDWTIRETGVPEAGLRGYRSAVAYDPVGLIWIAVGPNGADISRDDGLTWEAVTEIGSETGYHAIDFAPDGSGWAVGAEGRIARLSGERPRARPDDLQPPAN